MDCIIENEFLKIKGNTNGGELVSIKGKKSNSEYLWQGIPFWWKLYSPVLFPIIGKVKNLEYRYEGKTYFMPQHGFASRAKYKLIENKDNILAFELKNNEETEKIYPFKFSLINEYKIEKNSIIITHKVKNLDNKNIYFSLGVHPAIKCPMYKKGDELNDYYLKFNKIENSSILEINKEDFLTGKEKQYFSNCDELNLSEEVFKDGTLIFKNLESDKITLKSRKHNRSVSLEFKDFPYLAIWAPDRRTNFVCIEPWFGHADYEDFTGEIKDKEGIIKLEKNKEFKCTYKIIIEE